MSEQIPDAFIGYLQQRWQQREDAVRAVMADMTPFERRLASEMAVMGWVQGFMHARGGATGVGAEPKLPLVLDACLGMADQYPAVARLHEGGLPHEAPDWTPEVELR